MFTGGWQRRNATWGDLASAKANYMKVMEYDPDTENTARMRKKMLKDPEIANAHAVSSNSAEPQSHQ